MSAEDVVFDSNQQDEAQDEIVSDIVRVATVLSANETVQRFGSANAEYVKGYRGIDNATGQRFAKGLVDIANHKVNEDPRYATQNIKQQAGFSAEVATTSRDNAEAIISKSKVRTSRTDDLPQYGTNHNVVDRVQLIDGQVIDGSQSQMKFVGNRNKLLDDIAKDDGQFSRYRGTKLELPTEQYEGDRRYFLEEAKKLRERSEQVASDPSKASQAEKLRLQADKLEQRAGAADFQSESATDYCRKQAQQRRANADMAEAKGNSVAAAKLRREAENFDELAENVSDSGLTTEDAIFYRKHPGAATLLDIGRTAHRAGLEGAKFGAIIGGSISVLQNCLALAQGEKEVAEAFQDIVTTTAMAGALGYTTAFAGSAIKGGMQQSGNQFVRQLANTSAPTLAINVCLSLGSSIKRFVTGEIDEAQLLVEVGEKGAGMLSSGMMAAVGQLAIPVPFVGAAIGGMIGYTLSSMFYQSALDAARGAKLSRQQLVRVRALEAAARERIAAEQALLDDLVRREIPQLQLETQVLLATLNHADHQGIDALAASMNHYATLLGKNLQFNTLTEFDHFMKSDNQLVL